MHKRHKITSKSTARKSSSMTKYVSISRRALPCTT